MKRITDYFLGVIKAVRPFAIAAACALLIFSSASPALAFGNSSSKPSDGLKQLDRVQQKSEAAVSGGIESNNGARSVQKNASEGLNGVQGRANKGKMKSPSDANATSIEENVEEALEEVTP